MDNEGIGGPLSAGSLPSSDTVVPNGGRFVHLHAMSILDVWDENWTSHLASGGVRIGIEIRRLTSTMHVGTQVPGCRRPAPCALALQFWLQVPILESQASSGEREENSMVASRIRNPELAAQIDV